MVVPLLLKPVDVALAAAAASALDVAAAASSLGKPFGLTSD